jgi:hypothetical protein
VKEDGLMRAPVARLVSALTGTAEIPPLLSDAVDRLQSSAWYEVAARWSRLTPTGFPVELTAASWTEGVQWTAEVAPPETPDTERLLLAAALLAENRQGLHPALVEVLTSTQARGEVRFGAWVGGREAPGVVPRLKLYAEIPETTALSTKLLPERLASAVRRLPVGARPRMLGIEPARGRREIYVRLPTVDVVDLLPFLHTVGCSVAPAVLDRRLPDGTRRLAGRRLGLSAAWRDGDDAETIALTLFASARTLFPTSAASGSLDVLAAWVPALHGVDGALPGVRRGLVGMGLEPGQDELRISVGLVPVADER